MPSGAPKDWSVDDVSSWLADLNLEALQPEFRKNAVSGADLLELSDEDLSSFLKATPLQVGTRYCERTTLPACHPVSAGGSSLPARATPQYMCCAALCTGPQDPQGARRAGSRGASCPGSRSGPRSGPGTRARSGARSGACAHPGAHFGQPVGSQD
jgi:hypothetical protein